MARVAIIGASIEGLPAAYEARDKKRVVTGKGEVLYNYRIIATGLKLNFAAVPGLGPSGYTQSVCNVDHAEQAGGAHQSFLEERNTS